jgi:hypothetical protein
VFKVYHVHMYTIDISRLFMSRPIYIGLDNPPRNKGSREKNI